MHLQVLFAAVLGAMALAVVFAPVLKKPAARLNSAFKAADWEASFLFHDSSASHFALCHVLLIDCVFMLCWDAEFVTLRRAHCQYDEAACPGTLAHINDSDGVSFCTAGGRQLADAMASTTACASCTIRLYRALLGDCSHSAAQAAPVVAFFVLQALPLVLICCRRSGEICIWAALLPRSRVSFPSVVP